jgi:hypothetical protein
MSKGCLPYIKQLSIPSIERSSAIPEFCDALHSLVHAFLLAFKGDDSMAEVIFNNAITPDPIY